MVFPRHSSGKIWSFIFTQDIVLHDQINPIRLRLYQTCLTVKADENDY